MYCCCCFGCRLLQRCCCCCCHSQQWTSRWEAGPAAAAIHHPHSDRYYSTRKDWGKWCCIGRRSLLGAAAVRGARYLDWTERSYCGAWYCCCPPRRWTSNAILVDLSSPELKSRKHFEWWLHRSLSFRWIHLSGRPALAQIGEGQRTRKKKSRWRQQHLCRRCRESVVPVPSSRPTERTRFADS